MKYLTLIICLLFCAQASAEEQSLAQLQQRIAELEKIEVAHQQLQHKFDKELRAVKEQLWQTEKKLVETTRAKDEEIEELLKQLKNTHSALDSARKDADKFGERMMRAEENLNEVLQMNERENIQYGQERYASDSQRNLGLFIAEE